MQTRGTDKEATTTTTAAATTITVPTLAITCVGCSEDAPVANVTVAPPEESPKPIRIQPWKVKEKAASVPTPVRQKRMRKSKAALEKGVNVAVTKKRKEKDKKIAQPVSLV